MTQYDLVPEVIYNALEKKMGEMINQMNSHTYYRQIELAKECKEMYIKSHEFDARLRDLQIAFKKESNVKDQFNQINSKLENMDLDIKKGRTELDKL